MSEQEQQRSRSPLESERGSTNISDSVVSKIAGRAARNVEGVRMGGSVSRTAGGILENVTGSQNQTRGISAEVGRIETAIDVTMGIEYGRNILELAQRVRDSVTERVENLTGLRVAELNVTVDDIVFPEQGRGTARRRGGPSEEDRTQASQTQQMRAGTQEERDAADTEPVDLGAARSEAITRAGRRFSQEMRPEDRREEDETAELRLGDEETERDKGREG